MHRPTRSARTELRSHPQLAAISGVYHPGSFTLSSNSSPGRSPRIRTGLVSRYVTTSQTFTAPAEVTSQSALIGSADPLDENAATSQPPNPDRPRSRDTSHDLCCGRVEWVVQGRRGSVDATC